MAEHTLSQYFASKGRLFNNPYDVPAWLREQLIKGYQVELEHGSKIHPRLNVSDDRVDTTVKIALAHLTEAPDYYDRLERLEREADSHWSELPRELNEKKQEIDKIIKIV